MSGESVKIVGLNKTIRGFKEIDAALPLEVKALQLKAAEIVATDAKGRAPRISGDLAGSIRPSGSLRSATVRVGSASIPYAGPIHFGWRAHGITAQPFLYDALEAKRAEVYEMFDAGMHALTERAIN